MSTKMKYVEAVGCRFAIYLYENNYLNEYCIQKEQAQKVYNQNFKVEFKIKLNFWIVFHCNISLLKKQENHTVMVYKQIKLQNLRKKQLEIDSSLNLSKGKSPIKIVSHSVSFSKDSHMSNGFVSEKKCELCDVTFETFGEFEEHLTKEEHRFFEEFAKNVVPTKTQSQVQFTIDDSRTLENIILRKNVRKTLQLKIKNSTRFPMTITKIQKNAKIENVRFIPAFPHDCPPSVVVVYELSVLCQNEGVLCYPILISTEINQKQKQYAIQIVFHTHDKFFDDLHPSEPYRRRSKQVLVDFIEEVDSGERPKAWKLKMKVPLPKYPLSVDLSIILNAGLKPFEGMTEKQKKLLDQIERTLPSEKGYCLSRQNYTKLLDLLLYIEEHQMMKDIREYDREDQTLNKVDDLFELEVPGLAEHRPSVIYGDSVYVRESKQSKTLFEGVVHEVHESSIGLKFSPKFESNHLRGKQFYVHFSFNRYTLRVEHQAVELVKTANVAHLLFPKKTPTAATEAVPPVNWFNKDVADNPEQQRAICAILGKTAMPSPYVIFGPPGTGKTVTVVEAIKQIHKLTDERILICTPSNDASNEIARRLVTSIPTTDLFRFIARSFAYRSIPKAILKYTNYSSGIYQQPSLEDFMKYRIVITTLASAARLVNSGLPSKHFSYVFVDEAGQATESETLIAIAGILTSKLNSGAISGQIVLVGDPKQLGPIVHSVLAKEFGFDASMLERLMDTCDPYKKHDGRYNPFVLTKLLKNYRSHGVIVAKPNELFYDDELQVSGDHLINVGLSWEYLPNRKFPMIFHSVVGVDQREKTSPSFFNIQEVQIVLSYLEKLIGNKLQGMKIKEEHVGILTPYKKQAEKIRRACGKKKYSNALMIGTVEQFQGQEKLIIIISTVRSKTQMLRFDQKFNLGFLINPKRFNVAITRAKALLIVVGNPKLLQLDKYWRSFIRYCRQNGAVLGEKFDLVQEDKECLNDVQNVSLLVENGAEETPSFSRGVQ